MAEDEELVLSLARFVLEEEAMSSSKLAPVGRHSRSTSHMLEASTCWCSTCRCRVNGLQVARAVRALDPQLPIVLVSAIFQKTPERRVSLLAKPYTPDALIELPGATFAAEPSAKRRQAIEVPAGTRAGHPIEVDDRRVRSKDPLVAASSTSSPPSEPSSGASGSLGRAVGAGIAVTAVGSLWVKAVSFGTQIALGYLLLDEEWGIYAIAASVAGLANLLRDSSVRELLVQRGLESCASSADHCSGWRWPSTPRAAAVLLVAAAPTAAFYRQPQVATILLVMAGAILLETPGQFCAHGCAWSCASRRSPSWTWPRPSCATDPPCCWPSQDSVR